MNVQRPEHICYGWGTGSVPMPRPLSLPPTPNNRSGYGRTILLIGLKDIPWIRLMLMLALVGAIAILTGLLPKTSHNPEPHPTVNTIAFIIKTPIPTPEPLVEPENYHAEPIHIQSEPPTPIVTRRNIKTPAPKTPDAKTSDAKTSDTTISDHNNAQKTAKPDQLFQRLREIQSQPIINIHTESRQRENYSTEPRLAAARSLNQKETRQLTPPEIPITQTYYADSSAGLINMRPDTGHKPAWGRESDSEVKLKPNFDVTQPLGQPSKSSGTIKNRTTPALNSYNDGLILTIETDSTVYKLGDFSVCVDPELEFDLRTRIASILKSPQTCESAGGSFRFKSVATAYSLHVEIWAAPNILEKMTDQCTVLESALRCLLSQ